MASGRKTGATESGST